MWNKLSLSCLFIFIVSFPQLIFSDDEEILAVKLKIPKKSKSSLECPPPNYTSSELFPLPCSSNNECKLMGSNYLCCPYSGLFKRCERGVKASKKSEIKINATIPPSTTSTTTTTSTTPQPTTTTRITTRGPTKAAQLLTVIPKMTLVCPAPANIPYTFFRFSCKIHKDCSLLGSESRCCKSSDEGKKYCTQGVRKIRTESAEKKKESLPIILEATPSASVLSLQQATGRPQRTLSLLENTGSQEKCPSEVVNTELFPLPCRADRDCKLMGGGYVCCPNNGYKYCIRRSHQSTRSSYQTSTEAKQKTIHKPLEIPQDRTVTMQLTTTLKTTTTTVSTTTTTTTEPTTTKKRPSSTTVQTTKVQKSSKVSSATAKKNKLCLKSKEEGRSLFGVTCKSDKDCPSIGANPFTCCQGICVQFTGRPKRQKDEENLVDSHNPILGVIPRECPTKSFGEFLFEVKTCEKDSDCWPRICCPDGKKKYCKRAMPRLDMFALTQNIHERFKSVAGYVQCSKPPKNAFFKPRECETSLDCLPNLCCQEGAMKFCRPPEKSIIGALAGSAAVGSAEALRNLTPLLRFG